MDNTEIVNQFGNLILRSVPLTAMPTTVEHAIVMKNQNYTPEEILEFLGVTDDQFQPEMVFVPFFNQN